MLVRFHAKPHSADPSVNPSIDRMYSRVCPIRRPSHPVSGTTTPRASV